ncbi:purine-nucleoside phosphorylase [Rhodocaloribacter litoris]|uniref:purine-nucleoside phosphorylase n=1 Tax=Rhodocaloribacter litoris TaxID=2558931 RepID=UPI001E3D2031|nr:purine-nucleoside phosphorylase [Rhodocaloribacter litoris]
MSDSIPPAADVREAVAAIRREEPRVPEVALVLGSGLGDLAEAAEAARAFPTAGLPGYPHSTVEGHRGRLVFGRFEGREVVFVQGRVHLYEGHPVRAVAFPIRLVHALGARRLVVTNAAGGIHPLCTPGTLMFITDHINFAFANPLVGPNRDGGPRFPDMSAPYDPAWIDRAEAEALRLGIATRRGVYLWTRGPSYETRAEIQAFRRLGADAVGMSTVPEVIQARYLGMQVLGISTITNYAAGLHPDPLLHEEVLRVGRQIREDLERLVRGVVRMGA